jgi:hypothetical protein
MTSRRRGGQLAACCASAVLMAACCAGHAAVSSTSSASSRSSASSPSPAASRARAGSGSGSGPSPAAPVTTVRPAQPADAVVPGSRFAPAKLQFDLGLGIGAFQTFVEKPADRGELTPVRVHTTSVTQAIAAAALSSRQLSLAAGDVKASPALSPLSAQLGQVARQIEALGALVADGRVTLRAIRALGADLTVVGSHTAAAGVPVIGLVPTAAQLMAAR